MAEVHKIDEILRICPQFRILVIGRANSGKTTILQKVCNVNADAKPVVHNRKGRKIWFSSLRGDIMRGNHNIEHQITYEGSRFIFHDSCGFESGAEDEWRKVKSFIASRCAQTKMK